MTTIKQNMVSVDRIISKINGKQMATVPIQRHSISTIKCTSNESHHHRNIVINKGEKLELSNELLVHCGW